MSLSLASEGEAVEQCIPESAGSSCPVALVRQPHIKSKAINCIICIRY